MNHRFLMKYSLLALMTLVFTFPALAQKTENQASPLSGSWKWNREGLTGAVRCELHLVQRDGKMAGTYKDGQDVKAKVGKISLEDKEVNIELVFDNDGKTNTVMLVGKLKGRKIDGKIVDGTDEQKWRARQFTSLGAAAGKWRMEFTTPDGTTRNPEFVLKINDGKPAVEFESGEGGDPDSTEISKVKFKDGLLTFNVALDFQGQELSLEYEMTIEGDELEGTMYFEFSQDAGMNGDVDLDGERIK